MAVQLGHKALAEGHHFPVGLALGVKVRAALAAANGQAGQAVFENLLKAQELDDAQVDGRMEPQAALVGANGGVELHAEAAVHLDLAVVVHPGHAEHNLALGLHDALQDAGGLILGVGLDDRLQRGEHLGGGLDKLRLAGIFLLQKFQLFADVRHSIFPPYCKFDCKILQNHRDILP